MPPKDPLKAFLGGIACVWTRAPAAGRGMPAAPRSASGTGGEPLLKTWQRG